MNQPIIRQALASDLPRLLEIYNEEVEHGTATFDTKPLSLEDRRVWFEAHNKDNHPLIVLEQDNTVWGYASLSTFNAKPAYASSTELSVYVHKNARGLGYGQLSRKPSCRWPLATPLPTASTRLSPLKIRPALRCTANWAFDWSEPLRKLARNLTAGLTSPIGKKPSSLGKDF